MKIRKSLLSVFGAFLLAMSFTACTEDWGSMDYPAGNQTTPTREVVATYDFEYSENKPEFSDMLAHNDVCEVTEDDNLASHVLHLSGAGAAKYANPFTNVKLQNGAAITFFVKVASVHNEEKGEDELDPNRVLFSFGSDNGKSGKFSFTANGGLVYSKPGQLESLNLNENDPDTYLTDILTPDQWHLVALQVTSTGYQLYVDRKKSLSGSNPTPASATTFSYQNLLDFLQTAPNLYIGTDEYGKENSCDVWVDGVNLIRNMMDQKDWDKEIGGGAIDKTVYVPVGKEDCSSAWWTDFSDYFAIPANRTLHLRFKNYTSGAGNWNNWNLCLATDADRDAAGYSEYFVIRSDQFGWGAAYDGANFSNEGYPSDDAGWTLFRHNMQGATVDMTIERDGAEVNVTAVAECEDGTIYTEKFKATCGDGNQTVRAFLIVDGSYLKLMSNECYVKQNSDVTVPTVGTPDCTAAWWTTFSDYFQIPSGYNLHLDFVNHTSGANNWNNWNLCVATDADRDTGDYSEYFVIRSDLYGWGDAYNGDNFSNEGYDDWDKFRKDMEGAIVSMDIVRDNTGEVYVTANAVCTSGAVYKEMFHAPCGSSASTLRAFLIVDGSCLEMDPEGCYIYKNYYDAEGNFIK